MRSMGLQFNTEINTAAHVRPMLPSLAVFAEGKQPPHSSANRSIPSHRHNSLYCMTVLPERPPIGRHDVQQRHLRRRVQQREGVLRRGVRHLRRRRLLHGRRTGPRRRGLLRHGVSPQARPGSCPLLACLVVCLSVLSVLSCFCGSSNLTRPDLMI